MHAIKKLQRLAEGCVSDPIKEPFDLADNVRKYAPQLRSELELAKAPYGRFLIAENCNITVQAHYHSPMYAGQIHDHGTWGIMMALTGDFALEDWAVERETESFCIRKYLMPETGFVTFDYITGYDWHRNSNLSNFRALSLHIYGPNYDNNYGKSYDPNTGTIVKRQRLKMDPIENQLIT